MPLYSLSSAPPEAQTPEELWSPLESPQSPALPSPTPASDICSPPARYLHTHATPGHPRHRRTMSGIGTSLRFCWICSTKRQKAYGSVSFSGWLWREKWYLTWHKVYWQKVNSLTYFELADWVSLHKLSALCFYCTTKTWSESTQVLSLLAPYLQNLLSVFDPSSFKHPLGVCNPDLPRPAIFAHRRNNGAICLASKPGQGRQLSPSLAPAGAFASRKRNNCISEPYSKTQYCFFNLIFFFLNSHKPSQAADYRMNRRKKKVYQNTYTNCIYS